MTRRQARNDIGRIIEKIHSENKAHELVTAASVNRQTVERIASLTKRIQDQLSARFVGGSADFHNLSIRTTTKALSSIQETVSAIGATLLGHVSAKGKLPDAVTRATELSMSPTPQTGSIIFHLHRTQRNELVKDVETTVLDNSFQRFFEVIELAAHSAAAHHGAPDAMRDVGPRAARHIFQLCEVLVSEGMGVDFDWANSSGTSTKVSLTRSSAQYLKTIAKNSNKREESRFIIGVLQTVSIDKNKPIEILSFADGLVKIYASPDVREGLGVLYNQRVAATVKTTETMNIATGVVSEKHELVAISLDTGNAVMSPTGA